MTAIEKRIRIFSSAEVNDNAFSRQLVTYDDYTAATLCATASAATKTVNTGNWRNTVIFTATTISTIDLPGGI